MTIPFICHKCGGSLENVISKGSPIGWWYHPACRPEEGLRSMRTNLEDEWEPEEYYSVEEASKVLKLKVGTVRAWLDLDKVATYKFKSLTLLSKFEVDEIARKG